MAKSGADVQFDHDPSPIRGMKIIVIRGAASQIEAAVRFVSQMTGAQVSKVSLTLNVSHRGLKSVTDIEYETESFVRFLTDIECQILALTARVK